MDLREMKTRRSITNAFIAIRSKKPLERITVKELCEKAEVSKATFYLHYHDIYDLSDTLQQNVIKDILKYVETPTDMVLNPRKSGKEMIDGFYAKPWYGSDPLFRLSVFKTARKAHSGDQDRPF